MQRSYSCCSLKLCLRDKHLRHDRISLRYKLKIKMSRGTLQGQNTSYKHPLNNYTEYIKGQQIYIHYFRMQRNIELHIVHGQSLYDRPVA